MNNMDLYQNRLESSRKISKSKQTATKIKTFKRALDSSFNSEIVSMNDSEFKALVTGIPTNPKIGKKRFSTLKESDCEVGDEIYWIGNDSYWLISEHDSTETSIFQGEMQKTVHNLQWKDPILNKIYSARACVKGPDETTISNGVKHSIMFDSLTDSLYLIVSAKVEGSQFLKRYFQLMIGKKKWEIQVVDNMTTPNLIFLQLMESSIDRDSDTPELVGGKNIDAFKIKSTLDGIEFLQKETDVEFNPILIKNGSMLPSEKISVRVSNCLYSDNLLSFRTPGLSSVTVKFEDYNESFTWKIQVLEELENSVVIQEILGSDTIKTLSTNNYILINTKDGEKIDSFGEWSYSKEFLEIEEISSGVINVKTKNKTGLTVIKYIDEDLLIEKTLKVIPLFGGN